MRKTKVPPATVAQLEAVAFERAKQDARWGEQNHDLEWWVCILGEEFGELAQAVLETKFGGPKGGIDNCYREAKQVAAVATAIMERIARAHPVTAETLPIGEIGSRDVPMPMRLKGLADYFASIYKSRGLGDYLMTTGDRAGAAAVLRAAADDEQARGWVRWYLADEWYSRNCPTLAAMGKQINAVRAKIGAKSGAMTDELWREDA